jgi:hydroxyethylthiazole kinase-like uncharacterized protein yjeF
VASEIITTAQMRAIDAGAAAAGIATRTLMENAGRAVAEAISGKWPRRPTLVICGPGNNSGDGWVAARILQGLGWPVRVATLVPLEALRGDAADAARAWAGESFVLSGQALDAELLVDAMFGAGLSRPLDGEAARAAQAMAMSPNRVCAVDVPSGLHGDTGRPLGEICARAALTVTFVRKKPAHVLMPGRTLCGDVVVADIGAPEAVVAKQQALLWENGPDIWLRSYPWPSPETHKHARGHVMVASGGHAHTGAARLAAGAALRVGAGLVTVLSPPDAMAENAAHLTAIMLREAPSVAAYGDAAQTAQAMVVGPAFGLDDGRRAALEALLSPPNRCGMVIDADAITLLAPLQRRFDPRDVLTPHVGEFKRAFAGVLEKAPSRIEAVRAAAAQAGCTVLLKGPDTVIAAPDGRAVVNTNATPFLATAGSGDVLAGLAAGLMGQGAASFEAASIAAWLHGAAAAAYGPGLIAEDLTGILPSLLKQLALSGGVTTPPN